MNVGERIYCHTACYMRKNNHKTLTVGKFYTIRGIDDGDFYIIDDDGDEHFFSINETYHNKGYIEFFYKEPELRKQKLKKLNVY